jgi:type II secretory pathway pseudopilin PulG
MKISSLNRADAGQAGASAFTLAEMLIAMGIFSMVIASMVAVQLFGLRVYTLAATKLNATAGCRKALNQVREIAIRRPAPSPTLGCRPTRSAMPC